MPKGHRFDVEYAKSNMATCRVCMAKIPKGELRIGHTQVEPEAETAEKPADPEAEQRAIVLGATRWHHFGCFPKMKGQKWMSANLPLSSSGLLGYPDLKKADQKKLESLWKVLLSNDAKGSATAKRKAQSKTGAASLKRKKDSGEAVAAKRAKLFSVKGVLTDAQYKKVQRHEEQLAKLTSAQLQSELLKNDQVRGGTKETLVQRVAEGRVLGTLPTCPRCKKGQIHFNRSGGWYSCPGYFDAETRSQKRCNFRTQDLQRGKWKQK